MGDKSQLYVESPSNILVCTLLLPCTEFGCLGALQWVEKSPREWGSCLGMVPEPQTCLKDAGGIRSWPGLAGATGADKHSSLQAPSVLNYKGLRSLLVARGITGRKTENQSCGKLGCPFHKENTILAILLQSCTILLKPVLWYDHVWVVEDRQISLKITLWVWETTKVLQAEDTLQRCQKWDTGTDNNQNAEFSP